jgi:hypothetical protein
MFSDNWFTGTQDVFLGLAIWGSIDPTNILIPPAAAPWVISFA